MPSCGARKPVRNRSGKSSSTKSCIKIGKSGAHLLPPLPNSDSDSEGYSTYETFNLQRVNPKAHNFRQREEEVLQATAKILCKTNTTVVNSQHFWWTSSSNSGRKCYETIYGTWKVIAHGVKNINFQRWWSPTQLSRRILTIAFSRRIRNPVQGYRIWSTLKLPTKMMFAGTKTGLSTSVTSVMMIYLYTDLYLKVENPVMHRSTDFIIGTTFVQKFSWHQGNLPKVEDSCLTRTLSPLGHQSNSWWQVLQSMRKHAHFLVWWWTFCSSKPNLKSRSQPLIS